VPAGPDLPDIQISEVVEFTEDVSRDLPQAAGTANEPAVLPVPAFRILSPADGLCVNRPHQEDDGDDQQGPVRTDEFFSRFGPEYRVPFVWGLQKKAAAF